MSECLVLALLVACSRTPPPIANTSPPSNPAPLDDRCARKLPWVEKTTYFHYSEVQNGHLGFLELHADFNRLIATDTFNGVVVLTYRDFPDKTPKVEAVSMTIPATEIAGWLRELRDHVQAPADPPDSRLVVVHDSSRSMHMSIEAVPYEEMGGEGSVQFYSEEGERSPTPWGIRGCRSDARQSALRSVAMVVERIHERIGRDAMFKKLGLMP